MKRSRVLFVAALCGFEILLSSTHASNKDPTTTTRVPVEERLGTGNPVSASGLASAQTVCLNRCKSLRKELCTASSFIDFVDHVLPNDGITAKHLMGAWATTAWDPGVIVPAMFAKWAQKAPPTHAAQTTKLNESSSSFSFDEALAQTSWPSRTFVPFLHALIWWPMRMAQEPGTRRVDGARLYSYAVSLLGGDDLRGLPVHAHETIHGIGHGALFAAARAFDVDAVSCASRKFSNVTLAVTRAAESVCDAAPTRSLGYLCAVGLYHSFQVVKDATPRPRTTTPNDGVAEDTANEDEEIAAIAHGNFLDACDGVSYAGPCVYTLLRDAMKERAGFKKRLEHLIVDDNVPRPGALASLCPETRWPSQHLRRGCFYGVAAAFARVNFFTANDRRGTPTKWDWCRPATPSEDHVDDSDSSEEIALAAACVSGAMLNPAIFLSDHVYAYLDDSPKAFADSCAAACAKLAKSDDAILRAAAPYCESHAVCVHLDTWFRGDDATLSAARAKHDLVNAALLDGGGLVASPA